MKASDEYKVGSLEDAVRFDKERDYQYELPFDQPVCYAMINKDGSIYDVISCEEHDREEGEYTVPLYRHPVKENYMNEVLNNTLNIEKNHNEKAYKELYEVCVKQQAEIEALKAHPADLTDEEIWKCHDETDSDNWVIDFARAILRKASDK